ncbi:MAG: FliA/WhiG family RNA polymerase sigma factor [Eubacteriales bacterium]
MYNKHYERNNCWSEEYIDKYLPLVKRIAGRIAISLPSHIDEDDLISYGVFGLLDALKKFDSSKGVKFETYAGLRIRGGIIDGLRAMDWVPHSARKKVKEIQHKIDNIQTTLGRNASMEEISAQLNMTLDDLNTILLQGQYMTLISFEDMLGSASGDGLSPINMIIDNDAEKGYIEIEKEEVRQILEEVVDRLTEKQKLVVALYYREEMTLKEIAKVMELSESRISQLHSQAILRLRGYLSRKKKKIM